MPVFHKVSCFHLLSTELKSWKHFARTLEGLYSVAGSSELPVKSSELRRGSSELPAGSSELQARSSELQADSSELRVLAGMADFEFSRLRNSLGESGCFSPKTPPFLTGSDQIAQFGVDLEGVCEGVSPFWILFVRWLSLHPGNSSLFCTLPKTIAHG